MLGLRRPKGAPASLSHLVWTMDGMELERGVFRCDHCGEEFPRRNLCGRKPQYCTRSCRQRSYEARRRLQLRHGRPVTELVAAHGWLRRPVTYEPGTSRGRRHLLRPEGMPDPRRFRPTLCGTYARALPFNVTPRSGDHCGTCTRVADRHPPDRPFDASTDAAVLRTLAARLRVPRETSEVVDRLLDYCCPVTR